MSFGALGLASELPSSMSPLTKAHFISFFFFYYFFILMKSAPEAAAGRVAVQARWCGLVQAASAASMPEKPGPKAACSFPSVSTHRLNLVRSLEFC